MEKKELFNPKQLTSARIARGYTMKELSEKTNISRQMISNYESGKTVPQAENLLKIITALNFPKPFFTTEIPELHHGATFFRSQSAATKKSRDMQKEKLKYLYEVYRTMSEYVNFPHVNLPSLVETDINEISEEIIISKARELRELWGLDNISPIKNLVQLVEKNGIIIAEANMTDATLDAVSRWIVDRPFIMLTDNNESSVRRRFNIAHEIGHLILHNSIESIHDYSSKDLKNVIERQANMFASHFLLPSQAFEESLLSISLDFYTDLKKYWKVSIQAMIFKTYSLGLLSDDQRLYLNKKISRNKWRKKEPLDDVLPVEHPNLLKVVYDMITEHRIVNQSELNSSFRLPKDELERIISADIFQNLEPENKAPILRLIK
ncbi:helix-turn-helix domain-containing protein [Enterococcus gallinarum]|uniref:ImmA/IrrE family metallo-endopeptidase n=1 Tax=Enterococcus gallinarum TaxID=1353 RepID=A0AAE7T068_ENTGA|nr:XRE family transcriptional regulator [Enterococcus gallinarum]MBM6742483.1 XRE family transcriptional regulator [Enterococcus gallinarum]QOG26886.1 ImmA/IrrE family metallo-endopeptidase [Enterococcus gallinarum]RBT38371.1 zinc-binding Cro/CI family transcriptional regulator [Enterococcus gallinarum]